MAKTIVFGRKPGRAEFLSPAAQARLLPARCGGGLLWKEPTLASCLQPFLSSLHAQERDSEANQQRREAFRHQIQSQAVDHLIFLDESGLTTQMTRLWGRALWGQRMAEATPQGHWQVLTVLGSPEHPRPARQHDYRSAD